MNTGLGLVRESLCDERYRFLLGSEGLTIRKTFSKIKVKYVWCLIIWKENRPPTFNELSRVRRMPPLDHTLAMGVLHQRTQAGTTV